MLKIDIKEIKFFRVWRFYFNKQKIIIRVLG